MAEYTISALGIRDMGPCGQNRQMIGVIVWRKDHSWLLTTMNDAHGSVPDIDIVLKAETATYRLKNAATRLGAETKENRKVEMYFACDSMTIERNGLHYAFWKDLEMWK